jgi:hypothetical protein
MFNNLVRFGDLRVSDCLRQRLYRQKITRKGGQSHGVFAPSGLDASREILNRRQVSPVSMCTRHATSWNLPSATPRSSCLKRDHRCFNSPRRTPQRSRISIGITAVISALPGQVSQRDAMPRHAVMKQRMTNRAVTTDVAAAQNRQSWRIRVHVVVVSLMGGSMFMARFSGRMVS